ncbi:MAG: preprotein translocase subunit SecY, partial [Clostridiales bacterium]|nr:preprotein translocase subunit SecY [Clostridiales bacterium]
MFETLKNAWKIKEVRVKLLITLALLLVFRLGAFIPIAGINIDELEVITESLGGSFLSIMDAVVGGSLSNGTIFALGISPYITASIIIQLLTVAFPALERLSKEGGEEGRKKIAQYTRIFAIVLAVVQGIGILLSYRNLIDTALVDNNPSWTWVLYVAIVLQFAAGTALCMWVGERITDYGVGNGISLLIFTGIIASAGSAIRAELFTVFSGTEQASQSAFNLILFVVIVTIIFALIVWVDLAERKIPVQYAKQIKGRKIYGGKSTYIPIRINASGVMPLIFAYALLSFPSLIISMFNLSGSVATWFTLNFSPGRWLYTLLLSLLILFFAFFYAQIQFNPDDISRSIQQYGGFIPGIRPGRPTTDHLRKISNRITLFGAIFLALIALVPSLILSITGGSILVNAISTTGL